MKQLYITFGLLVSISFCSFGQSDSLTIASEQVEVIKRYEAAILQARKKKINYTAEEKQTSPIAYNYNVTTEKVIDFDRPDPEIKALSYKGEPVKNDDLKDGYVYGAYGNYKTINAGGAYHYYIEDWLETGFKVDHFSSQDSLISELDGEPLKKMTTTDVDAYLGYYLGKQTKVVLRGIGSFADRNVSFGTIGDTLQSVPLNQLGADLGFSHNIFEDKSFAIRVGGSYLKTSSDLRSFEMVEHRYGARMNIIKGLTDNLSVEVPFSYERMKMSDLSVGDFKAEPTLRMQGQNYNLKAGLQYITGDQVSLLFPLFELKLESVFAGIDLSLSSRADYNRNSLSYLSEMHSYHNFTYDNYSPSYNKSYTLGLDYSLQDLGFSLDLSYNDYENEVNFQDFSLATLNYVHRDAIVINPEVSYELNEAIQVGLDFEYHIFLTDSLNLYYRPKVKMDFHAKQTLFDSRLELVEMISLVGNRDIGQRLENSGEVSFMPGQLPSFWDLSIKLNYRLSPSFDLFAKVANLLGQDYVIWNPIYAHKQQIWGGIKFRL